IFALGLCYLDQVTTTLFGQLWDGHAQNLAVIGWVDAQVRVTNSVFDLAHHGLLIRLNEQHAWLRNADGRHLRNRSWNAIVFTDDSGIHRRLSTIGTYSYYLITDVLHRVGHTIF